ncbi:MAG: hypothetical protein ACREGE_03790 [Candidatus Microsaccharimonas sp.]
MRRIISIVAVIAITVSSLALLAGSSAYAEDLTPDQAEHIKTNCVSIKSSLNQLHASDALLRVNRGQVYEAMASKLMDTFNDRLSGNRLDNKAMVTVTANYRSALNDFRTDYIQYEQKLATALRTDCTTQPNSFYRILEEARQLRKDVHADVTALHRFIDDYRSSVSSFLLDFERIAE